MLYRRSCSIFSINRVQLSRCYAKRSLQEKKALKEEQHLVDVLKPLEGFTRRLIDASAAGNANVQHRDGVQLWSTIPKAAKPHESVPSLEKAQFVGDEKQPFVLNEDGLQAESGQVHFPPGTFVEIRRNQVVTFGVIMQLQVIEARQHAITLTYTGEIWPHLTTDITYSIPSFVSQDLLRRAGSAYHAADAAETAARLTLVQQIRTFARRHERHFLSMGKDITGLYETLRHPDPDCWSEVTTPEATRHVDVRKPPPMLRLFAVHSHLMNRPLYFVADPRNHKSTHRFSVRPLSHVQTILQVHEWVRTYDPAFQSFLEKARPIIKKAREIRKQAGEGAPEVVQTSFAPWSPTDLVILRYLQQSLRTTRTTQIDPYETGLPNIAKRLGLYQEHVVTPALTHLMLCELGVLTPWDDIAMRTPELNLDLAPPGQSEEAQAINELVDHNLHSPGVPVAPSLKEKLLQVHLDGSVELHARDTHEAVRHDFGNLPVYVVDDVDAHELDDGLSIEPVPGEQGNYWVHVHVADPTTVIPPGHVLDLRAQTNAVTVYSAHRAWGMLPHTLMQPRFSLGSKANGEAQEVLTFSIKLSDRGDFLDYKVQAGLVHNIQVLHYDQVDHMLGIKGRVRTYPLVGAGPREFQIAPIPQTYQSDLRKLYELADTFALRTIRENNIISFSLPKAEIAFENPPPPSNPIASSESILWKGYPSITYYVEQVQRRDNSYRHIIAEYMKLACRVASRFCVDKGVPAIRRASTALNAPSEKDMADVLAMRSPIGTVDPIECIKRHLYAPAGEPTLEPLEHWALAIPEGEGYTRVTSPLRRYTDLLMHWQIKNELLPVRQRKTTGPLFPAEYLKPLMFRLIDKEKAIAAAVLLHQRHWAFTTLRRYIENHRDKHGPGFECFPSLSAQTIGYVGYDTRNATGQVPVIIQSLGLRGMLKGVDQLSIPVGTTFPVKIVEIALGLAPTIILAPT